MRAKHFVITRFNLILKDANFDRDKAGNRTLSEDWLGSRFKLFERYCLPSLQAQTDQDFTWLLLFHGPGTPQRFRDRLVDLGRDLPQLKPLYFGEGVRANSLRSAIMNDLPGNVTHIITTRIDNDDAFQRSMIARVKAEFRGQDNEFLNFPNGLQLDVERRLVSQIRKRSNPFMSRVERIIEGNVATVFDGAHSSASARGIVRDIEAPPTWLQVIHKGNISNQFRPQKLLGKVDLALEFGIAENITVDRRATQLVRLQQLVWDAPRRSLHQMAMRIKQLRGGR